MASGYIIKKFRIDGNNSIIKVEHFILFWEDRINKDDLFFNIIYKYLKCPHITSSRFNRQNTCGHRTVRRHDTKRTADTVTQRVNHKYEVNVQSRCNSTKLICSMSLIEFERMCLTGYYDVNKRHIVIPYESFAYDNLKTIEENMKTKVFLISKSSIRQNRTHIPLDPNLLPQLETAISEMNKKIIERFDPDRVNIYTIAFKTINEYYLFIITLFVLDPLHDFRSGFRNNVICSTHCRTKGELSTLKTNIRGFLNRKFEMIREEWRYAMRTFDNNSNTTNREQFDKLASIIGPFAEKLFIDAGLESTLINSINTLIEDDVFAVGKNPKAAEAVFRSYDETLAEIIRHSPKFILNNACSIVNDLPVIDNGVFVTFQNTISDRCKSNCATLYDGASGGVCGSLAKSFSGGGLEFGAYHIRFTYQDSLVSIETELPNEYVEFICDYHKNETQREIYQHITINRKTATNPVLSRTTHKFKIFDTNGNTDIVKVDDEILGYYDTNEVDVLDIKSGDFGRLVNREQQQPCDVIHTCRKALCDFGQYLNSVIKSGGYYDMFYEKNIFPTRQDLTFKSQYIPTSGGPIDYPVLTMHTDQPATALNMLLLSTIPVGLVNNMAHTVYMTSANVNIHNQVLPNQVYYFSNSNGSVCKLPVISGGGRSGKQKGGTALMYGGESNYFYRFCKDEQEKIKVFNILFTFFSYCITFQMPLDNIIKYNEFYDKYSNYMHEYTNEEFMHDVNTIQTYNQEIEMIQTYNQVIEMQRKRSKTSSSTPLNSSSTPSKISRMLSPSPFRFPNMNLFKVGGTKPYTKKYRPKYRKHTRKTYFYPK
jgi:hypothetical protein